MLAVHACGDRPPPPPPPIPGDAAPVAVPVEVPAVPLGLPDPAGYGWRKRGGQPAFQSARAAEKRGDWSAVVAACRQALAADPGHLEASWLLAVGLARLGKLDEVLAPLQRAAAGELARWGRASLEQPALQPFLATPAGEAWRRRVDQDRARYLAALARSLIVTANGELHAYVPGTARDDSAAPDGGRWLRLTRAPGTVIAALASPTDKLAYVARVGRGGKRELGIGVVDLGRGTSSGVVALGTRGPITVAYSGRSPAGFWVGTGAPRATVWRRLDEHHRLQPLPPRTRTPKGPRLEITAKAAVRLHALPPRVTADWDDQALAGAIRIATSNRVVAVPSPGLIDGNTVVWSPDRVHLAFVVQLDDRCVEGAPSTAAFVADALTGNTRELERAAGGIALQWYAERKLAIAGDGGVAIHSLDDGARLAIEGATGLLLPRERPRCAPPDVEDDTADEPAGDEPAGDEPVDAGVVDGR
jgi:hypothetical protein